MKTRKKDRKDRKFANLREQIKESPVRFAVYLVLRAIVIAVLCSAYCVTIGRACSPACSR